ncbi:MAG: hypothetical protein C4547_15005, partial [Phycisphaerales bacterium]
MTANYLRCDVLLAVLFWSFALPSVCAADQSKDLTREFIDGRRLTFSTKDHPKARGANFTIAYPSSWKAAEGERPHIVQKFVSEGGRGFEIVMI